MTHTKEEKMEAFGRFLDVLDTLRQKCPWDRKQTNETLRTNTIEEVFELCDALLKNHPEEIAKELGDVLLHICFYALIGQEKGQFDIADVCNLLTDKLLFRHPHVYHPSQVGAKHPCPLPFGTTETDAGTTVNSTTEVLQNWEQIKLKEKNGNKTVLSGVPGALPSLIKAYRIQDKVRNVGFDWQQRKDVWKKVREELDELEQELETGNTTNMEHELGDFLFSVVNAARLYGLNPDDALEHTNRKFISRFNYVEQQAKELGTPLNELSLDQMDAWWNEAKALEKQ